MRAHEQNNEAPQAAGTALAHMEFQKIATSVLEASFSKAARIAELNQKELLTTEEVAEVYGYNVGTLMNWRRQKRGPAYVKDGRIIRYRKEALRNYFESKEVRTLDQR
ncbi:hypothetical protein JCM16814_08050 [Desulfobaculum senezii]